MTKSKQYQEVMRKLWLDLEVESYEKKIHANISLIKLKINMNNLLRSQLTNALADKLSQDNNI